MKLNLLQLFSVFSRNWNSICQQVWLEEEKLSRLWYIISNAFKISHSECNFKQNLSKILELCLGFWVQIPVLNWKYNLNSLFMTKNRKQNSLSVYKFHIECMWWTNMFPGDKHGLLALILFVNDNELISEVDLFRPLRHILP